MTRDWNEFHNASFFRTSSFSYYQDRAVSVRWAHGHVPTQYFEIYLAVHPISDVLVNCVPTQYLAPRYGTALGY